MTHRCLASPFLPLFEYTTIGGAEVTACKSYQQKTAKMAQKPGFSPRWHILIRAERYMSIPSSPMCGWSPTCHRALSGSLVGGIAAGRGSPQCQTHQGPSLVPPVPDATPAGQREEPPPTVMGVTPGRPAPIPGVLGRSLATRGLLPARYFAQLQRIPRRCMATGVGGGG